MRHPLDACALAAFLCLVPAVAGAQWAANGVGVTTAPTEPVTHAVCPDGGGGILVAWSEVRNGTSDILIQRIPATGIPIWIGDGVVVCGAAFAQTDPSLCPDGVSGAIVTWRDQRNGGFDIYAQRIDAGGEALWTADGIAVCDVTNNQYAPTVVSDDVGGAIIVWYDFRALNYDIYAQRVDTNGNLLWQPSGVAACAAQWSQYRPSIVSDGNSGTVVSWTDLRNGNADVYAQRIDATGTTQWQYNGVALCKEAHDQLDPIPAPDGAGGVIVAWRDVRAGDWDIYAQRVDAPGIVQWTANGTTVCDATFDQLHPAIASDGAGGALVVWDDARGPSLDISAQRLDASGVAQWTADGASVCNASNDQSYPSIASDGVTDAVIVWEDRRMGNADVYAQRLAANGAGAWAPNGVVVCDTTGDQTLPFAAPDGSGGVVTAWKDARSGNVDLYANRLSASGGTPTGAATPALPGLVVSPGYPNPFGREVRFEVGGRGDRVRVEVFDVTGCRVARRETRGGSFLFDGRDDRGIMLPAGVYLCRFRSESATRTRKVVIVR